MNLFEKIKETLKSENPVNYNKFIKNLEFDEKNSTSTNLIIKAPNIFIANFVKRKYLKKIEEIYEKETGIKPQINIITKEINYKPVKIEEIIQPSTPSVLIPEYTFESFIVGPSNQFAYTAAKSVAENPGKNYNPLFIYGGVGLGKTHLLQAIGNYLKNSLKVLYVTSKQFMNEFTENIRLKTPEKFHEKYKNCDILLIDDVQFFAGKERTQEEFFHIFNDMYNKKKQICLTADRPPKKLYDLVDRLRSRFEAGLIVDIQPPELETKIEIIRKKCELNGIYLPDEIIEFIATKLDTNIREIEGMITKINAMSKILGVSEITLDFAKQALKEFIKDKREVITLEDIIKLIAKEFNIKPSEIISKSRNKNIVQARRCAIYLAREFTKESTPSIAKYFGLKDHSAVSHAIKSFNKKLKEDSEFRMKIEELKSKIQLKKSE
ncbi:MAG: chromosomal replication initiator protein DnaA [Nautiliaceae bacterium]